MNGNLIPKDTVNGSLRPETSAAGSLNASNPMRGEVSTPEERPVLHGTLTIPKKVTVVDRDYEQLINKPSINNIELIKNKDFEELGLEALTNSELEALLS